MHTRTLIKSIGAASVLLGLLAACGGGGGGEPAVADVAGTQVPQAATQDPVAATAFVKQVAATSSDSTEPLVVGDATLATSETAEPDPGV